MLRVHRSTIFAEYNKEAPAGNYVVQGHPLAVYRPVISKNVRRRGMWKFSELDPHEMVLLGWDLPLLERVVSWLRTAGLFGEIFPTSARALDALELALCEHPPTWYIFSR